MNLRDRLRLMRPGAGRAPEPGEPSGEPVGESLGKPARELPGGPTGPHLPGPSLPTETGVEQRVAETACGPVVYLEQTFPLDHRQGRVALASCLDVPSHGWQRLLPRAATVALDAREAVFVDLETTGLGRGTGTYAFLVGIGRFTGEGFRVRQYFMRNYPEEPAVLAAVRAELEDARSLITFNGRTFDWPLLETRATLNRMRLPLLPHLDLLHPARRVWRPVTDSCSLGHLETAVLGLEREDDVPGALIPQLYFDYIRSQDPAPLAGVFRHNRLDIVSMAAVAGYLGQAAAAPLDAAPAGTPLSGAEVYALGRLLFDRGALDEAIVCFREALRRGMPHALRREAYRWLAIACRRVSLASRQRPEPVPGAAAGHGAQAGRAAAVDHGPTAGRGSEPAHAAAPAPDLHVAVLHDWVREDGVSTWPYVELAKYYEHRARDLEAARAWTLKAIDLVQRRRMLRGLRPAAPGWPAGAADRELEELLHRLRRIEAKLASRGLRWDRMTAQSGMGE